MYAGAKCYWAEKIMITRSWNDVEDVGLDNGEVPSHVGLIPDGCFMP